MTTNVQSKKLPILVGVFVAQIVLAVLLFVQGKNSAEFSREPLIAASIEDVDSIEVVGSDGEIKMTKLGSDWFFDSGLPVREENIDFLLDALAELQTAWPVASTPAARERFKVAEETFERKIILRQDDKELAKVFVGSSPSFRHSHIRMAEKDEIYSLVFDAYATPASVDGWLDTRLLRPEGKIQEISNGSSGLVKVDGEWPKLEPAIDEESEADVEVAESSSNAESEEPSAAQELFNAEEFEKALEDLVVIGVAENLSVFDQPDEERAEGVDADDSSASSDTAQKFSFTVKSNEGEYKYELMKKESDYFIRSGQFDQVFKVSKNTYESLSKILMLT